MIRAYLHKKQLLRRRHIQSITILQHMLVNCFKAQSFKNYNLAKNKMQPTSFRKRGGSSVNTKTHHLSILHFREREENLNLPSILFKIVFFFLLTFFRPVHTVWNRLSIINHHKFAESVFGWSFHNCRLKLIAFDIWHSSSRNLFPIIQIVITKEINKSYFFIMDAIIKKFPGSIDVSHETNKINKSDLGT